MPLPRERVERILDEIETQTVAATHGNLTFGAPQPAAIVLAEVNGQETLGLVPLLDIRSRFEAIREAVESMQADGFVFVYDGFVRSPEGEDADAVLVVRVSRWAARAYATPYIRDVHGTLTFTAPLQAPPGVQEEYQRVFAPWQGEPVPRPS